MPARPAPQGPWALHVLPPGISLRTGFQEEGKPWMDIDRRRVLVGAAWSALTTAVGGSDFRPALTEPSDFGPDEHPLTRSLLERARRRGRVAPDRSMAEQTIRQFADSSGWTRPLVIKWMATPSHAHDHLSRLGLDALLDMGTTGFWRRAQPRASHDDDRAFEVRMLANSLLGVDDHDRMLMAPKLLAKSQASSTNLSDEALFRVRAVSAQIGWLETSIAEAAAQAVANVEALLCMGESEGSVAIDKQLKVFEAYEHGLVATWETPDALICVPKCRI
jgi:hypothetical protein